MTPLEEMNPVSRRDGYFGYGYMWWIWDGPRAVGPFEGAYTARGAIGQWITVFPAIDVVLAHKTNSVYGRTTSWESYERLIELLFEAKGIEMEGLSPGGREGWDFGWKPGSPGQGALRKPPDGEPPSGGFCMD